MCHLKNPDACVEVGGESALPARRFATQDDRLNWIAVGVDEVDLAEVQFPDACLDFRAVTDHDPYEVVRMDDLLRRGVKVTGFQRADFSRHGVVIIVGPSGMQYGRDRDTDGVQRFARPWQTKGFIGFRARPFLPRFQATRENSAPRLVS